MRTVLGVIIVGAVAGSLLLVRDAGTRHRTQPAGAGDRWWRSPAAGLAVMIGLIEWRLHNQYTVDDIALRSLAAVVVPLGVARLFTTGPRPRHRSDDLPGLLVFVASVVGLGLVCLVVYDTALLYNLGHLDEQLPMAGAALLMLAAARAAARALFVRQTPPPGRGVCSLARSTGWLLVLAVVPALPIRYGLGFGAPYLSAAGTLVLVVVAAELGRREAFAEVPGGPLGGWLLQMAMAGLAGLCGAATALLVDADHTETRLLLAGAAGLVAAISACAYLDRRAGGWSGDGGSRLRVADGS